MVWDLSRDRSPNLMIMDVLFITLATISCLLRCYTRVFVVRAFGIDDWLMLVAVGFYVLYIASGLISAEHGGGRHQDTLSDADLSVAMRNWWLCYLWYDACMVFARLSIGIFFLRLTVKRLHRYLMYLVMVSTVLFGLVFLGVAIGECTPPAYFWDKTIEGGWCVDTRIIVALMYLYSASSLFSDATYAIFPIFLMKGLQMDRKTKYAVMPILGLGWVASIAVLIRFAYLTTLSSEDFTYDAITIAILSSAEQGLAITAGNLVTLRPLFTRKFGLWSSLARDGNSGANQHPPTIGALDRAKGRAASAASDPGEVGLATFLRGYATDEESGVQMKRHSHILEQQSVDTTTDGSESSQKRNSNTWCAPVDDESESQNGLHHQSSRDTLTDIKKAMPATFLAREGRLRDSGGT
ncbi:hypothetical protein G7054_g5385 [Neopestalotiopsis clavispora]|nr:hypothetical protein G7054_g5385 [Neopestalotiopsis clavispora]